MELLRIELEPSAGDGYYTKCEFDCIKPEKCVKLVNNYKKNVQNYVVFIRKNGILFLCSIFLWRFL